jgi:hypothetical protein
MKIMTTVLLKFLMIFSLSCNTNNASETIEGLDADYAVVQKVSVSGKEGSYTFSVELKSPDKGCNQYANWWEVVTEDEILVYRRILGHSHVQEQPFTRSGSNLNILAGDAVIIRGHMNTTGYGEGEIAMKGTVEAGFQPFDIDKEFGAALESATPQPNGCAF